MDFRLRGKHQGTLQQQPGSVGNEVRAGALLRFHPHGQPAGGGTGRGHRPGMVGFHGHGFSLRPRRGG